LSAVRTNKEYLPNYVMSILNPIIYIYICIYIFSSLTCAWVWPRPRRWLPRKGRHKSDFLRITGSRLSQSMSTTHVAADHVFYTRTAHAVPIYEEKKQTKEYKSSIHCVIPTANLKNYFSPPSTFIVPIFASLQRRNLF